MVRTADLQLNKLCLRKRTVRRPGTLTRMNGAGLSLRSLRLYNAGRRPAFAHKNPFSGLSPDLARIAVLSHSDSPATNCSGEHRYQGIPLNCKAANQPARWPWQSLWSRQSPCTIKKIAAVHRCYLVRRDAMELRTRGVLPSRYGLRR
jgi:hypothetical protein